ncbi:hypothetical protein J6590_058202 [Homalodisca vitripennis]|nr:hypothetical protein J6590_058202 [Homalodisca vitripennis]
MPFPMWQQCLLLRQPRHTLLAPIGQVANQAVLPLTPTSERPAPPIRNTTYVPADPRSTVRKYACLVKCRTYKIRRRGNKVRNLQDNGNGNIINKQTGVRHLRRQEKATNNEGKRNVPCLALYGHMENGDSYRHACVNALAVCDSEDFHCHTVLYKWKLYVAVNLIVTQKVLSYRKPQYLSKGSRTAEWPRGTGVTISSTCSTFETKADIEGNFLSTF